MNDFAAFDNSISGAMATIGDSGTSYADMNKGITPLFFTEQVEDGKATEAAGTLKVIEMERVRLLTAGDVFSAPVHPVTAEIKERFADQYERWKRNRTNDHIDGTPLAAWPLASQGFVMEMKALNIRSVEDLAAVADVNLQRITDGRIWRAKAEAWLTTSKDAGKAAKYAADSERRDAENADLKRQLAELAARIDAQEHGRGGKKAA